MTEPLAGNTSTPAVGRRESWFERNKTFVSATVSITIAAIGFASAIAVTDRQRSAAASDAIFVEATDIDTSALLLQKALHEMDSEYFQIAQMLKSYESLRSVGHDPIDPSSLDFLSDTYTAGKDKISAITQRIYTNTSPLRGRMLKAIELAESALQEWPSIRDNIRMMQETNDAAFIKRQLAMVDLKLQIADISYDEAFCAIYDIGTAYRQLYEERRLERLDSWNAAILGTKCDERQTWFMKKHELDSKVLDIYERELGIIPSK